MQYHYFIGIYRVYGYHTSAKGSSSFLNVSAQPPEIDRAERERKGVKIIDSIGRQLNFFEAYSATVNLWLRGKATEGLLWWLLHMNKYGCPATSNNLTNSAAASLPLLSLWPSPDTKETIPRGTP